MEGTFHNYRLVIIFEINYKNQKCKYVGLEMALNIARNLYKYRQFGESDSIYIYLKHILFDFVRISNSEDIFGRNHLS